MEIAKRHLWSHQRLLQERPDVAYTLLAIDFVSDQVLGRMLQAIASQLLSGDVRPLQNTVHRLGLVAAALRQLLKVLALSLSVECELHMFIIVCCHYMFMSLVCAKSLRHLL